MILLNTAAIGEVVTAPMEGGRIHAGWDYFRTEASVLWSWRGHSAFLLFYRWLLGENIDAQIAWYQRQNANVVRVLGMVAWPNQSFGPQTPGYWMHLSAFVDYLAAAGLRVEFVTFADAQKVMPDEGDQRLHLWRIVDLIGPKWNVFIEIGNEPWQNGVVPTRVWSESQARQCPMAYGDYDDVPDLKVLDYLTYHSPRDGDAWSRKAKNVLELRDGPMGGACHKPVVDDEPMGAAEADRLAGRQRSNNADDFFWHHAVAHLFGAGSTFHSDAGLQAVVPDVGSDQQRCADAVSLVWSLVGPEWQSGRYTRSGLTNLPLVWDAAYFPEQTSRIYGMVLGDRALCVAVKPNEGWKAEAANGWRIVSTAGPRDTLVLLAR